MNGGSPPVLLWYVRRSCCLLPPWPHSGFGDALPIAAVPRCHGVIGPRGMEVWTALPGDGYAGGVFYDLEFSNVGRHTCTLRGYPRVVAVSGGHQVGRGASHGSQKPLMVTLRPGATAHALLQVAIPGWRRPSVGGDIRLPAWPGLPPADRHHRVDLSPRTHPAGRYADPFRRRDPVLYTPLTDWPATCPERGGTPARSGGAEGKQNWPFGALPAATSTTAVRAQRWGNPGRRSRPPP